MNISERMSYHFAKFNEWRRFHYELRKATAQKYGLCVYLKIGFIANRAGHKAVRPRMCGTSVSDSTLTVFIVISPRRTLFIVIRDRNHFFNRIAEKKFYHRENYHRNDVTLGYEQAERKLRACLSLSVSLSRHLRSLNTSGCHYVN